MQRGEGPCSCPSGEIASDLTKYIQLIGGGLVALFVLMNQDGVAHEQAKQVNFAGAKLRKRFPKLMPAAQAAFELPAPEMGAQRAKVAPHTLEVSDLTVRYGGVIAVDGLSLTVRPGQIVGLIGPNGRGKPPPSTPSPVSRAQQLAAYASMSST